MFTPRQYLEKAKEYRERVKTASSPNERREFEELERGFTVFGNDAQWLADNRGHAARKPPTKIDAIALDQEEEHSLRCLGAALILQWNTVPMKLRREILDSADAMGELLEGGDLQRRAARALHEHRNGGEPA